jgi:Rhodanese-like domain
LIFSPSDYLFAFDAKSQCKAANEAFNLLAGATDRVMRHLLFEVERRRFTMADAPRITVEELKGRMESGEDFTLIDTRNPQAWAESDTQIPEAIRVPVDELEANLPRISKSKPVVAYCT